MKQAEVEQLFRRYGSLVHRRARAILRDEEEARDALQDVFVRVVKNIDDFRQEASPSSWLYRITTNLCLNRVRDRARQRDKLAAQPSAQLSLSVDAPATRLDVARALQCLPAELAEVAVYYHIDGMSQQEIAELLNIPRRTVSYRITSFEKKARQLLEKEAS